MTLEEAKQLKAGDRVLVEAEVICAATGEPPDSPITSRGNVAVKVACSCPNVMTHCCVAPEAIRKKVTTARRKFKKGDIVLYDSKLWFIHRNEDENGIVEMSNGKKLMIKAHYSTLDIVCAAENREDRKGEA